MWRGRPVSDGRGGDVYCLTPLAEAIFQLCERPQMLSELVEECARQFAIKGSDVHILVLATLAELHKLEVLAVPLAGPGQPSRREFLTAALRADLDLPLVRPMLPPAETRRSYCL